MPQRTMGALRCQMGPALDPLGRKEPGLLSGSSWCSDQFLMLAVHSSCCLSEERRNGKLESHCGVRQGHTQNVGGEG